MIETIERHSQYRNIFLMHISVMYINGRTCSFTKARFAYLWGLLSTLLVSSVNYIIILSVVFSFIKYALCAVYLARFLCYWRRNTPTTL